MMRTRLAALLMILAAAALCSAGDAPPLKRGPSPVDEADTRLTAVAYDNGDVSPWAEFFLFDSPTHPRLVQLREEHKLDELVKDAKTDLDRALILKTWVAGALKFGYPAPEVFSDWSAVALLDRAKNGQKVWCGQAAMVFQQACLVMGMPARFIELGVPENPACHFTTEVFLREHGKWAVIDATPLREYDMYYTVDDVPQSALDMHRHVVRDEMAKVTEVHPDRTHGVRSRRSPAWAFYFVRWLTHCDVVTNPPRFVDMEHTFDRMWHTVEWEDDETVPWEEQKHSTFWTRNERLSAWRISDPDVVYWTPTSSTKIVLRRGNGFYAQLWTADPDLHHFSARINDEPWTDLPQATEHRGGGGSWGRRRFPIPARRGVNEVRVRAVRSDGTFGPESFVQFTGRR